MPLIQDSVSVAANATNNNVLAGAQYEFLPAASRIDLYLTGSAAGLRAEFLIGGRSSLDNVEINANNRVPLRPDDYAASDVGRGGERLQLRLRNTTGAALTGFWAVDITFI